MPSFESFLNFLLILFLPITIHATSGITTSFPNAATYIIPTPFGTNNLTISAHWLVPPSPKLWGHTTWQRFGPKLCSPATYSDLTTPFTPYSAEAPLVNDCLALHVLLHVAYDASYEGGNGLGKFAGHWSVTQRDLWENTYVGLASFGTCAVVVGIRKGDDDGAREESGKDVLAQLHWGFAVGTEDVRQLLWESVSKFQRGGVVESMGSVPCLTWTSRGASAVAVDWGVVRMRDAWVQLRDGTGEEYKV
jgi:hypothetical protein